MKRRPESSPPVTELNTIGIAPLAIARGAASTLVRRVQRAVEVVQAVRSSVKSVSVIAEPVRVEVQPQMLNQASVMRVLVGLNEVALHGGVHVRNVDNTVTLSMNLDAYLVDSSAPTLAGKLLSQASCRFNTRLQVELRETIDSAALPTKSSRARKPPLLKSSLASS